MMKMQKVVILLVLLFMLVGSVLPTNPNKVHALDLPEESEPSDVLATDVYESDDLDPSLVPIDFEVESMRTEFEKYFRKIDGTYEVAIYDNAIHYLDEGVYKDIDNTLSLDETDNSYENIANKFKIKLPKIIDDNKKFKLTMGDYRIDWTIDDINSSDITYSNEEQTSNNLKELANINQSVTYSNIQNNVDLEYILSGNSIKENIILNEYIEDYSIGFNYYVKNLSLIQNDTGDYVFINDSGEEVFSLSTLYMIDSNGEISYDIEFNVIEVRKDEYQIEIIPANDFLSAASYPVVIDPALYSSSTSMQVYDTYIREAYPVNNYSSSTIMVISNQYSYDEYRGLIYFYIPSAIMDQVITYSYLSFAKYSVTSGAQLNLYKNTETFASSSATWNNAPSYDTSVVDYYTVNTYTPFMFEITESVKEWQATGNRMTTGFTIALDEQYGSYNAVYQMGISTSSLRPLITIGYEDPAGLKDYWTYTSQDMGMIGSGNISDYTGNLTWIRNEYNLDNEYMPLTLSFFYSNYSRDEDIGYGAGWRTNYNMQILHDTTSNKYYLLNPDGNKIYFDNINSEEIFSGYWRYTYIAEDGSRMELERDEYQGSTQNYKINTTNDIKYYFNSIGRLYRISNLKTYHDLNIYYIDTSSQKIDYVTDEANNRIEFSYSGDRMYKTELQLKQSDSSLRSVERRYYYYDTYGNTNYINYDYRYGTGTDTLWTTDLNDKLEYTFDSDNKFVYAYNLQDNYKIEYSYDTAYRVENILVTDNTLNIGNTDISYETGRTIYTDYEGDSIYYTFDNYGHTINIMDDYGNCTYYKYSGLFTNIDDLWDPLNGYNLVNAYPNYYNNHNLIESSDVIKQQQNPLNNHGFEEGSSGWTLYEGSDGNIEFTNSESMLGDYSLAVTKVTSSVYATQSVYLEPGSYTITAWIKNDGTTPGAYVDVIGETYVSTINKVYSSDGWEKYTLAFYLSNYTTVGISLINESVSTAYFDNIQLTEGSVETRYNAILNNSFEESTSYWTINQASRTTISETGIMSDILGRYAMYINGDGSTEKSIYQDITSLITNGETYIVGAWGKADAVPNKAFLNGWERSDDRFFGLMVKIECVPTEQGQSPYFMYQYLPFNTSIEEWQYQMLSFEVPDIAHDVVVYAIYQGEGTAYFDNIQLYHDKLSTEYGYDSINGNIISINSSNGTNTTLGYDENNNLDTVTQDSISSTINRTSTYLVEEIDSNNVRTTFEYDSSTKQMITVYVGYDKDASTQDKWFKSTIGYSQDGQYIYSTTDEFGNTNYTNTNSTVGRLSGIIDAIGNSQTFEYDRYGNLVSTTANEDGTSATMVASYEYDNQGKLEIIHRDGYYYEFVYNNLDQLLFVRINDGSTYENLMEYDYWEETVGSVTYYTDLLKKQTYGNDDYVSFTYTDENQIQTVSFNNTVRYEYEYDSSGRLSILKDIHNSNIYFYSYDLAGRLETITDKDGNEINYTYDEDGNLNHVNYNIGLITRGVTYHYNSTTGEYDYTQYQVGTTTITKDYDYDTDSLKRLNTIELAIGTYDFTKVFEYDEGEVSSSMGNATNRISSITYNNNGTETHHIYLYDDNQNITRITVCDSTWQTIDVYDYFYDGFNQLVRENIKINSGSYQRTFVYEYDDQGNITCIYEYEYTTLSTISTTLLKQKNLDYDNTWADQLTRKRVIVNSVVVEDISYTYDDSGNPVTYYNNLSPSSSKSLDWEGRQLTEISGYSNTVSFKYNNSGLRTEKNYDSISTSYDVYYILDGNKILVEYRGNDTIYYTYDIDGSLLSMNYNGNEYFYITNMQGDIIELVDISGNTVVKYKYDSWGNIVYQYDSGLGIDDINPFRYRGYYFDIETGLYYLQSRYYNPEVGRFISADGLVGSLGNISSHNMYTYCANNPVMYLDPSGESFIGILATIGLGALIGGISGFIAAAINGDDLGAGFLSGAISGAIIAVGLAISLALPAAGGVIVSSISGFLGGATGDIFNQAWNNGWDNVDLLHAAGVGALSAVFTLGSFGCLNHIYRTTPSLFGSITNSSLSLFSRMGSSLSMSVATFYIGLTYGTISTFTNAIFNLTIQDSVSDDEASIDIDAYC